MPSVDDNYFEMLRQRRKERRPKRTSRKAYPDEFGCTPNSSIDALERFSELVENDDTGVWKDDSEVHNHPSGPAEER